MYSELKMTVKVRIFSKALSQHFSGETEENHRWLNPTELLHVQKALTAWVNVLTTAYADVSLNA